MNSFQTIQKGGKKYEPSSHRYNREKMVVTDVTSLSSGIVFSSIFYYIKSLFSPCSFGEILLKIVPVASRVEVVLNTSGIFLNLFLTPPGSESTPG